MTLNKLYYGDNLDILRDHFSNECVDLIYLDPPFNSSRNYNVLFKDESGRQSDAQITAFEDTWHWGDNAVRTLRDLQIDAPEAVGTAINALETIIGHNQMMAYLVMMTARLVELHRVLKPTGSLYLHCDPTASHYLKIILDTIFGGSNFRSEIIWKRTSGHSDAKGFGSVHDTIFFYSKSNRATWNKQYQPYDEEYVEQFYRYKDENGRRWMSGDLGASGLAGGGYEYEWKGITRVWRCPIETMQELDERGKIFYTRNGIPRIKRYLDESKGMPAQDVWDDIESLRSWHQEKLGYPTQKPLELLERIISASSNPGDVVLDPFCGCGTAVAAAQKLGRHWLGIDVTFLSIALMQNRLLGNFELKDSVDYEVIGVPVDLNGARALAKQKDRYQFQWWALTLIKALPQGGKEGSKEGKKGADKGIDGTIPFIDLVKGREKRCEVLVQVKSGHVQRTDIADLARAVEREQAAIGVFVTLEPPTAPMKTEALSAQYYHSALWERDYPRIQILTIEELLNGKRVDMPPTRGGLRQAGRVKDEGDQQMGFAGFDEA